MSDKQQQLTVINPAPVAIEQRHDDNPQALIALAIEKGLDLKELVAMRREWRAEKAKEAFDAAMAAFQTECPIIKKTKIVLNKDGKTTRYKFAPMDSILSQVKELLAKHHFSYSLNTTSDADTLTVFCKVKHLEGHSEVSEFKVKIDKDAFMNDQQKSGAASTFAKRYAFCNGFGILTGDQDTDANIEKPREFGPSKIATMQQLNAELWSVLEPIRGNPGSWETVYKWLYGTGVIAAGERVKDMDANRLIQTIESSKAQLEKESDEAR